MKKVKTSDIKMDIIENFIDYYASEEETKERMLTVARDYVNQDTVDEVAQSLGCDDHESDATYHVLHLDGMEIPSFPDIDQKLY